MEQKIQLSTSGFTAPRVMLHKSTYTRTLTHTPTPIYKRIYTRLCKRKFLKVEKGDTSIDIIIIISFWLSEETEERMQKKRKFKIY